MTTINQFKAARRVSVPLIIWKSPDAAATINEVRNAVTAPIFAWDVVRGVCVMNEAAKNKVETKDTDGNPLTALCLKYPEHSILFLHNAHLFTDNSAVLQAIWNLRDTNKGAHCTLVMLSPHMKVPRELENDVMVIDETLPDDEALRVIVEDQIKAAADAVNGGDKKFVSPSAADIEKAVDAVSGLSAFSAEQSVAVSFEAKDGQVSLNLETLWDKKRQAIEETRGLKVWREGETLDDVQGCENVKTFIDEYLNGKIPPRVIVFIDELEKAMAGVTGDTSGASQDQHGHMLQVMQDTKAKGMLFIGHPGSAKSMVAKAMGNSAGCVTIQMDMGAFKGSLLGESEQHVRHAFKVVNTIGRGRVLYIGTCNKIGALSPELQRRFSLGTFFFDLPTASEREAIWKHYLKKFALKEVLVNGKVNGVDDVGWTGADICNCCERAWMFNSTLKAAAKYATPVCKTSPKAIENLRTLADGAFLSANYEGIYQKDKDTVAITTTTKRAVKFED